MEFSELFKNQQPVYRWANGALESDETHKKLAAVTESGCVGVENLGPDTRLSTSEGINFHIKNRLLNDTLKVGG